MLVDTSSLFSYCSFINGENLAISASAKYVTSKLSQESLVPGFNKRLCKD